MAFAALLFGGTIGIISFLMALMVLDYGLLTALSIYLSAGFGSAVLLIGFALTSAWTRPEDT